ncbi:MAG: radical SAM/SPASM domain-containing protein [Desulfuromonadales bacterium]|nr:radical SAM/SPASM domain-containing protein [Desulfuromonadales bacterium]
MNKPTWSIANLSNATLPSSQLKESPASPATFDQSLPALRPYPSKLFVETTTYCNLQCSMCMKQTMGSELKEGFLTMETFRALDPAFPTAESLVLSGIGEPLLCNRLEDFIRHARSRMPHASWIGFQSNGLLLDENRAISLLEAGLDRICISVDSVSPETFSTVREGGELKDIDRAFAALNSARKACGRPDFKIGIEFVIMRDNLHELPSVLSWAASRGANFAITSHLLPYDSSFVKNAAYEPNTEDAINLFESWQKRAEAEGIDMGDYFKTAFLRYSRTPEQERMVAFVQQMMDDARNREIFLNVELLLQRDPEWVTRVEKTFAEAQATADRLGLEIRLPAVAPRSDRACDFLEAGSVFVSWDGNVHPCYFLWHKYVCYFTERKKHVSTKSFGCLADEGIQEIWNSAPYREFREEVLRHEYPFCANCNLIPCEYLYCEEFEQDCYTNTVPCGDCFWCMGLFNCMS